MSARAMAALLAGMSDDTLAQLFAARSIAPAAAWHDGFDIADALLTPESIQTALARVDRAAAIELAAASTGAPLGAAGSAAARALALTDGDGQMFSVVLDLLTSPAYAIAADDATSPATDDPDAGAHAAEQAFLTVARVAELLLAAAQQPLGLLNNGGLRSTERRRLTDAGITGEPTDLDSLAALALSSRLLTRSDDGASPHSDAAQWLQHPFIDRWLTLADRAIAAAPAPLTGTHADTWPGAYPWNSGWPSQAEQLRGHFSDLGLLNSSGAWTPWGEALLAGERDTAAQQLAAFVPHEVDRVFVQHDYTIMAPGPLEPRYDLLLRRFTAREASGHASGYRLTAEAITKALAQGMSADDMLALLDEISLTGTPQPVEYLIRDTAERYGAVRVSAHPQTGTTIIISDTPELLNQIAADRSLRMLGLKTEDDHLATPLSPANAHWALVDAGHPAIVDENLSARGTASTNEDEDTTEVDYSELIVLVRQTGAADSADVWLSRELEVAARERSTIIVEVAMPDGSSRELTLQVNAFSGGRLRGLDRSAEVERTLPVSSIRSARPA